MARPRIRKNTKHVLHHSKSFKVFLFMPPQGLERVLPKKKWYILHHRRLFIIFNYFYYVIINFKELKKLYKGYTKSKNTKYISFN